MRFQVPQFIEVESKIFGPLTIKQFIYLTGGAAVVFLIYLFLPFFFVVLLGVPVMAFSFGLSFYKVHNQPLAVVIENAFGFFSTSKLFVWKKKEKKLEVKKRERAIGGELFPQGYVPKLSKDRIGDLSWSLNIKEKIK